MTRSFMRFLRKNTIALLALFLALGGTTYAASSALIARNSVASPQVINGSLQTLDLSKKARKALKGNLGPRGAQGPAGAKGATGPVGPATGAAGGALTGNYPNPGLADGAVTSAKLANGSAVASKLGTIVQRTNTVTIADGTVGFVQVSCLVGERVLSGGATTSGVGLSPGWTLRRSSVTGNGWDASAQNATGSSGDLIVSAFCLQ